VLGDMQTIYDELFDKDVFTLIVEALVINHQDFLDLVELKYEVLQVSMQIDLVYDQM
jgi:hypothetical protein